LISKFVDCLFSRIIDAVGMNKPKDWSYKWKNELGGLKSTTAGTSYLQGCCGIWREEIAEMRTALEVCFYHEYPMKQQYTTFG
jgi:hypothetical protein